AGALLRLSTLPYFGPDAEDDALFGAEELQPVFDILEAATTVDIGLYDRHVMERRLRRRMIVWNAESEEDLRILSDDPHERLMLLDELVSRPKYWFRDPLALEFLKIKVFPELLAVKPRDGVVRVWLPACSTGEDVYSIAISFDEVSRGSAAI